MENLTIYHSRKLGWKIIICFIIAQLRLSQTLAQEGSQGNTTIFGGAQMTFFSNHNFVTGGGGAQPGVILTERAAGNFGVLNFAGDNLTSAGASDAGYVDGYVRKYGAGAFVFPVGDNGFIGQFAASADGVMGAYFHADANTAVTSNLFTGSNYAALPTGGPFATSSMGTNVDVVSTVEYWDIDGANATPLTLTWDAGSAIGTLTTSQLNKLTIVGWNGTQWVAIPSKVDTTSVLGGSSDLTAGSITTISPLAPDTYTAYTFAALTIPMPVKLVQFDVAREGNIAQLAWTTTEESNSDRFEVERSPNGKFWDRIGTVASHGESTILRRYSFVDPNPVKGGPSHGENLYRLKMIDKDETFAYSGIRQVAFEATGDIAVYPNPAVEDIYVKGRTGNYREVFITNLSGQVVYRKKAVNQQEKLQLGTINSGVYLVYITDSDGTDIVQKIVVRK